MCFGLRFVLAALADFLLGSIFQFSVLTFVFFHLYNVFLICYTDKSIVR